MTDSSTVLISGAGQLGSRHLQGLAACTPRLRIYVHDVAASSLERAAERWEDVRSAAVSHEVSFISSLDALPRETDVVISATTASIRPDVVEAISRATTVRHWILEKVLAQNEADLDRLVCAVGETAKAWVNTARRTMPWHQRVAAALDLRAPVTFEVRGGDWGLACNSVHFLDLVAWWTGEALVSVSTEGLARNWHESKRPGNFEVLGTLAATFSGGSRAILTASPTTDDDALHVSDASRHWRIDETQGVATCSDGRELVGGVTFQSQLTGPVVESILATGSSTLPTVVESAAMHRVLVGSLLAHWQHAEAPDAKRVPIT
jgi:predicted dehydrogenase